MNEYGFTSESFRMDDDRSVTGQGPWANSWYPAWLEDRAQVVTERVDARAASVQQQTKEQAGAKLNGR